MFRWFKYLFAITFVLLLHLFFYKSDVIQNIDHKFYDITAMFFNPKLTKDELSHTVIIDIDEKSLNAVGQWPWPRIIQTKLINKLDAMHPSTIGLTTIFPELDRSSPVALQKFYRDTFNVQVDLSLFPEALKNNDKLLAKSIKDSESVLPIYFYKNSRVLEHCERLSYKNNFFETMVKSEADTILCNHKSIQESVENFGFIDVHLDSDGLVRRMPIFMEYNQKVFPSFGLATLLSLDSEIERFNKQHFSILNHTVSMDFQSNVLLDFNTPKPKTISAIDILNNKVSDKEIQGKIVLIGSTATGITSRYPLSSHHTVSNVRLQSILIDNILNDRLHRQPLYYQNLNLWLSLVLSLLLLFFLIRRWYVYIFILFFSVLFFSALALVVEYLNGVYISIGYFWTPFSHYFFVVTFFLIIISAREEKKFYRALQESHSATVESLSLVVAMRDDETGEHLNRTKNYVRVLAEYLYAQKLYPEVLTLNHILHMYEAAPLHDIGKVGIPDTILKKPGKYTPEEYEVMKQHPVLAKNVIEKAMRHYDKNVFLDVAYNIAYYHHERWDGKGYPVGLKGDEIPLEAQLMALADVYDALVNKRCYKDEYDYERAESIIIEGYGTQFNPIIVDAFITLRHEFRSIAKKYKDETHRS
ncbi:MAG: CHASE2 domain-containing protein [Epsilonproteobacteria bacterium]|nr:CHASE2 domain-containing protein [Campylobacterota bacterium]